MRFSTRLIAFATLALFALSAPLSVNAQCANGSCDIPQGQLVPIQREAPQLRSPISRPNRVPDTVASATRGVMLVVNERPEGVSTGSGIYLGDGYVLTCRHIFFVKEAPYDYNKPAAIPPNWPVAVGNLKVRFTVSTQYYPASVVEMDTTADIVVLRVDNVPQGVPDAVFAEGAQPGEQVYPVGYAYGETLTTYSGGFTSLNDEVISAQLSVPRGVSGGPIFNAQGQVTGIATWVRTQVHPMTRQPIAGTGLTAGPCCFRIRSFLGRIRAKLIPRRAQPPMTMRPVPDYNQTPQLQDIPAPVPRRDIDVSVDISEPEAPVVAPPAEKSFNYLNLLWLFFPSLLVVTAFGAAAVFQILHTVRGK
jgi:hypothetical protein